MKYFIILIKKHLEQLTFILTNRRHIIILYKWIKKIIVSTLSSVTSKQMSQRTSNFQSHSASISNPFDKSYLALTSNSHPAVNPVAIPSMSGIRKFRNSDSSSCINCATIDMLILTPCPRRLTKNQSRSYLGMGRRAKISANFSWSQFLKWLGLASRAFRFRDRFMCRPLNY